MRTKRGYFNMNYDHSKLPPRPAMVPDACHDLIYIGNGNAFNSIADKYNGSAKFLATKHHNLNDRDFVFFDLCSGDSPIENYYVDQSHPILEKMFPNKVITPINIAETIEHIIHDSDKTPHSLLKLVYEDIALMARKHNIDLYDIATNFHKNKTNDSNEELCL